MHVLISHHYIKPQHIQEELELLNGSGNVIKKEAGFLYRQTLVGMDDPGHITTITFWRSKEDNDRWDASPYRQSSRQASSPHWTKPIYRVRFDVVQEFTLEGTSMPFG